MRPQNLQEFAEQLRLRGNEFADEILELVNLEEEVAEPYNEICGELDHQAPDEMKGKWEKQLEWLVERSHLLEEIEDDLKAHDRKGDVDNEVRDVLGILKQIAWTLDTNDAWAGDMEGSIETLCERPKPLEYDL